MLPCMRWKGTGKVVDPREEDLLGRVGYAGSVWSKLGLGLGRVTEFVNQLGEAFESGIKRGWRNTSQK